MDLEDTAEGSEQDFSESEETETLYNSREEQTESDEEIPKEETDPTIHEIECHPTQKFPEAVKPIKITSKERKVKNKIKTSKKEALQVSTKIDTSINLWCTRKMSPTSRTFQHQFLTDTGAEVTLIPLSLVKKRNLVRTSEISPYKIMGVNGSEVKVSGKASM